VAVGGKKMKEIEGMIATPKGFFADGLH